MFSYWQLVQKETTAALLWILENKGYGALIDGLNLLYANLSPDTLDEISELIYGNIPYTAKELTDMYDSELKYMYE